MRIVSRPARKPGKVNPIVLGLLFLIIGGFVFFRKYIPHQLLNPVSRGMI
ncbi:MAG: hypothetical protein ACQERS_11470 [Bacteroidota bacterium]